MVGVEHRLKSLQQKHIGPGYLQPCYSIHCAEVLEAKVGPIIHLCGIATVFRA